MGVKSSRSTQKATRAAQIGLGAAAGILIAATAFYLFSPDSADRSLVRLEQRIRDTLKLYTAEHIYRDVVYVGEERRFFGLLTRDRHLLFSIRLRVLAGIDLKKGGFSLRREGNRMVVQMPPAKIFRVDADEKTIEEYLSGGRGRALPMLSYFDEIATAKQAAAEDARDRRLLSRAERNARLIVENMLHLSDVNEIEFTDPPQAAEVSG